MFLLEVFQTCCSNSIEQRYNHLWGSDTGQHVRSTSYSINVILSTNMHLYFWSHCQCVEVILQFCSMCSYVLFLSKFAHKYFYFTDAKHFFFVKLIQLLYRCRISRCWLEAMITAQVFHQFGSTPVCWAHLSILVVNKEIPGTSILQTGDLQAVRMTDLLWLENCIQVLHADDSFGNLGLGFNEKIMTPQFFWLQSKHAHETLFIKHHGTETNHVSLNEVSEGEVFPGQQKDPLDKLLVIFALLPQCWLKHIWIKDTQ